MKAQALSVSTIRVAIAGFILSLLMLSFAPALSVYAADKTWDGDTNTNLGTAANWDADSLPVEGNPDTLIFDTDSYDFASNPTLTDDFTAGAGGFDVAGITFQGSTGDSLTLSPSGTESFDLAGNITNNESNYGSLTIDEDLTLTTDVAITGTGGGSITINGDIDLGANTLTISGTNYVYINGVISGTGGLDISGYAALYGANTYDGGTAINYGNVSLYDDAALGTGAVTVAGGTINVNLDDTTDVANDMSFTTNNATVNFSYSSTPTDTVLSGALTAAADVTVNLDSSSSLYDDEVTVTVDDATGDGEFRLTPGGGAMIALNGEAATYPPQQTINYNYDYTSDVTVYSNTRGILSPDYSYTGNWTIETGATLAGEGTITGDLDVDGSVAPGFSPSVIAIEGNVNLATGSSYEVELAGSEDGGFDQLDVTGGVTLSNPDLSVSFLYGYVPNDGDTFVIINNDASDAVTGTFNGIDEGDTVTVDGVVLGVSYEGGDGNDVELTVISGGGAGGAGGGSTPGTPDTGFPLLKVNVLLPLLTTLAATGLFAGATRKIARK